MKTLKTSATKISSPLKDSEKTFSVTTFSNSKKRGKSLKVYSALKNKKTSNIDLIDFRENDNRNNNDLDFRNDLNR